MRNKYTKEILEPLVKNSETLSEVCRKLNIKPSTGSQSYLRKKLNDLEISTEHFLGQSWRKGKSFSKKPIEHYLKNGIMAKSHDLKLKLIRLGLKEHKCEICGITEWNGKKSPIQLDHINGDKFNNTLENLRILCPNCHAQTDTYCTKNRGRVM